MGVPHCVLASDGERIESCKGESRILVHGLVALGGKGIRPRFVGLRVSGEASPRTSSLAERSRGLLRIASTNFARIRHRISKKIVKQDINTLFYIKSKQTKIFKGWGRGAACGVCYVPRHPPLALLRNNLTTVAIIQVGPLVPIVSLSDSFGPPGETGYTSGDPRTTSVPADPAVVLPR